MRAIELPRLEEVLAAQRTILAAEAFAIHYESLQNESECYAEEVRQRLLAGQAIGAQEYIEARQVQHVAVREFERALEAVDVLAAPTLPVLPMDIE